MAQFMLCELAMMTRARTVKAIPSVFGLAGRVARLAIGLFNAGVLVPVSALWLYEAVRPVCHGLPRDWLTIGLGLFAGAVAVRRSRRAIVWQAWVHELAHMVACLILMGKMRSFAANPDGSGTFGHSEAGPIRTSIIRLAPYTVPVALVPCLIAREFLLKRGIVITASSAVCSALLVSHLAGVWRNVCGNYRGKDSDISREGRFFSLGWIALALVWTLRATFESLWK